MLLTSYNTQIHRTASMTKNCPAQNINIAEDEKPDPTNHVLEAHADTRHPQEESIL